MAVEIDGVEMPEGWNYIAQKVLDTLAEGGADSAYLDEKIEKLYGYNDKYACFAWACGNLDSENLAVFAKKMGVTVAECRQFKETWQKL